MRITREEAAALGRRAEQPTEAQGELLAVWVPGRLSNPLNGTPWVWQKRTRYAKEWRARTALALLEAGNVRNWGKWNECRLKPKQINFYARTWSAMDSDGLQASLKPVRDSLVECGVISGDAESDGHEFIYSQRIDRDCRGVEIRVRLR